MSGWFILSGIVGIGIAFMAAYKLIFFQEMFRVWERIGLGLIAGCSLMSVPPALVEAATPFDEWAASGLRVGLALYLGGKVWRLRVHARRNAQHVAALNEWKVGR
ncbi:MAG TPA: hypothetical protein VF695_06285 [Sphingomonas sp.]|jgi:hypothetical protein